MSNLPNLSNLSNLKKYIVNGFQDDNREIDIIVTDNLELELKKLYFKYHIIEVIDYIPDVWEMFLRRLDIPIRPELKRKKLYILWLLLNEYILYFNSKIELINNIFIENLHNAINFEEIYINDDNTDNFKIYVSNIDKIEKELVIIIKTIYENEELLTFLLNNNIIKFNLYKILYDRDVYIWQEINNIPVKFDIEYFNKDLIDLDFDKLNIS